MKLMASFPAFLAMCLIVCFQASSAYIFPWPAYNSKIQLVCPDDTWTLFGNEQCYKYFPSEVVTRETARDNCRAISTSAGQGDLASIHDVKVNDLLVKLCGVPTGTTTEFWLGLYRLDDDVNFGWADGSPLDYTNWLPGEPSNSGGVEDCGHMTTLSNWNDIRCDSKMRYICQVAPDTIPRE